MEKIKITFLGTSDSIPTKTRNHTSILLSYKNENIMIDCGEGTQRQLKLANISPCSLSRILITHWHGDHILGLPGLFQTLGMLGYPKKLKIYGPRNTNHYMELIKKFVNVEIDLEVHEVENKEILNEPEFIIKTSSMSHNTPTNAYSFIIKDKMRLDKNKLKKLKLPNSPLLKNLQQGKDITFNNKKIKASQVTYLEKGRKITFILDTIMNENAPLLAKDSDILICESSFSKEDNEKAKEFKHLTAENAASIAKKANARSLILTHVSQRYQFQLDKIEKEAKKTFKNTLLAKDFQVIEC